MLIATFFAVDDFLRIARSFLLYKDLNEKTMKLLNRIKSQGAQSLRSTKALSKIIPRHEKALFNFEKILG